MLITTIEHTARAVFENMIPAEISALLDMPGYYTLGAIGEDEEGEYAAGVLVFAVKDGFNGEENIIGAELEWLYVAEEARRRGAADALMEEMLRVLEEAEIEFLRCDVPMGEEHNLLCAYLEAWGMHFTYMDKYECTAPLKEFLKRPFFRRKAKARVMPLRSFQAETVVKSVRQFQQMHLIEQDLEAAIPHCDLDVSCGIWEDGAIKAMLLARSLGETTLELMVARSLKGSVEQIMDLLLFAAEQAVKHHSPDVMIRIRCRVAVVGDLIAKFLPDAQPLLVRRGVLLLGMTAEEAEHIWEEERNGEV